MRKLCPSGYVARISHRQNTAHIPGKKCAANKRVYAVISLEKSEQTNEPTNLIDKFT